MLITFNYMDFQIQMFYFEMFADARFNNAYPAIVKVKCLSVLVRWFLLGTEQGYRPIWHNEVNGGNWYDSVCFNCWVFKLSFGASRPLHLQKVDFECTIAQLIYLNIRYFFLGTTPDTLMWPQIIRRAKWLSRGLLVCNWHNITSPKK